MGGKVLVAGVGMVPFTKPGKSDSYDVMGAAAGRAALKDAGLAYSLVEQAYVGYVYGDSTCGQAAIYAVGLTGIPVVNVNNNCATGSTALFLARQAVESGAAECALALGFEQMTPGALTERWSDRPTPLSRFIDAMRRLGRWDDALPMAPQAMPYRAWLRHMSAFFRPSVLGSRFEAGIRQPSKKSSEVTDARSECLL